MEALLSALNQDGVVAMTPAWAVGEQVRIIGGAFVDQLAVIDALPDKDRVRVLLSLMQTPIPIEIGRNQIARES